MTSGWECLRGIGRPVAATLCALVLAASAATAATITYKDGHAETVPTVLSQDGDAVWVVRADHQVVKIPKKEIASVVTLEDLRDAYQKRTAALKNDDASGRLQLAQWCFEQTLDGAGRRELKLAAAAGDIVTTRVVLRLAMTRGDTASARVALDRLRALRAEDDWARRVAAALDAMAQLEDQEKTLRSAQAQQTAQIARATSEIAALTNAINNPFQIVTQEQRVQCPRCWGTGRITTIANSLPQNAAQQHLISVRSIGDGVYDTYTVPLVITTMCPQCQGRGYIVTTERTRERIDTGVQQRRRDEVQKAMDDATAARTQTAAQLNEIAGKRKELTSALVTEAVGAAPAAN